MTFKWLYSRDSLQPLTKPQWDGNSVNNVYSSTMAGGLFSMHREYVVIISSTVGCSALGLFLYERHVCRTGISGTLGRMIKI